MGRFKHEGANVTIAEDGRVVAYMGDDERNDYLYKFVSKGRYTRGHLDRGPHEEHAAAERGRPLRRTLLRRLAGRRDHRRAAPSRATARSTARGQWIALTRNGESVVPGMSTEEVLVYTRLAADAVGATKMDRPEDVEPSPLTGKVYVALTNNSNRGGASAPVDEANPISGNRYGHVVELTETSGQAGETFGWSILLLCGDPSTNAVHVLRGIPEGARCRRSRAPTTSRSTPRATSGSRPTALPARSATTTGCSRCRSRATSAATCSSSSRCRARPRPAGRSSTTSEGLVFVAVQHPGENGSVGAPALVLPRLRAGARRRRRGGAAALRRAGVPGVGPAARSTPGDGCRCGIRHLRVVRRDRATAPRAACSPTRSPE